MGNNQYGGVVQSQYGYSSTKNLYSEDRHLDIRERRLEFSSVLRQGLREPFSTQVLNHKTPDIYDVFDISEVLGKGQFGITYLCTEISTGVNYACKSILKSKLVSREDVEDVKREIQIMHHLSGHENMVQIKDVYEDSSSLHIVMELCQGGELFEKVKKGGGVSEKKAAELIRIIVGFIQNCHSLGVMHRDIKLENFMLTDPNDELSIKAIDFGLSVFFKPGQIFKEVVGSPFYLAPEVLEKRYGHEADIFSAGVILYILLSGVPPFWAEDQQGIFDAVLGGNINFPSEKWDSISDGAKDLIKKMLCPYPDERVKAHEILSHPWICENVTGAAKAHDPVFIYRLKKFSEMNLLKRLALRVIGESLSDEETAGMKEMFEGLDTEINNEITFNQLKEGLNKYGSRFTETQIQQIMDAVDMNKNGVIECEEFIAATMPLMKLEQEHHLVTAFSYFDKNGDGFITISDLQVTCENISDSLLEKIIQEFCQNNEGQIDYSEFALMMKSGIEDECEVR